MPERDISTALDYLQALTKYIEALEWVRTDARFLAGRIRGCSDEQLDDAAAILQERIRMADELNPVMRCGS